jgi:hypothetical protein
MKSGSTPIRRTKFSLSKLRADAEPIDKAGLTETKSFDQSPGKSLG